MLGYPWQCSTCCVMVMQRFELLGLHVLASKQGLSWSGGVQQEVSCQRRRHPPMLEAPSSHHNDMAINNYLPTTCHLKGT